jgi:hypothetical protein
MTWTGWARVTEVDGSVVTAVAQADEKLKPYEHLYAGTPHEQTEMPGLQSNTEGVLKSVELKFTFEGEPGLEEGDLVNVHGHFDGKQSKEE